MVSEKIAAYQVGQRWSYHTRPADKGSTLVIGKIQPELEIIHVAIEQVLLPNAAKPSSISHLPFAKTALDQSVTELLEESVEIDKNFAEGLAIWEADKRGFFQLTVSETLNSLFESMATSKGFDPFDDLVKQMRQRRSPAVVTELYQRLFSLPNWFFLCPPDVDDVPIQWDFTVGEKSSPAVLGFTSEAKAIAAADRLQLYPKGVDVRLMPADIDKAILWLDSEQCQCEWVCFNFPDHQFPLYIADAVRLNLKR